MKRIVILQPGYLPWLGFFDLMFRSDQFVALDDVQYTVRDWRSRNRVKTRDGLVWLTVPVRARGVRQKLIKDVEIDDTTRWQQRHLRTLESFYRKARYFFDIMDIIRPVLGKNRRFLLDVDMELIRGIMNYVSLGTEIVFSSEIRSEGSKDERLLSICRSLRASRYLSGNAAKGYLREEIFRRDGIEVEWHNYRHPFYHQLWIKEQGFISHLSAIDLLFNHGPESLDILTGKRMIPQPRDLRIREANER